MYLKIFLISSFLAISVLAICQTETTLNLTDKQGRKQGHWIKRYPNEAILYDGYFKDDHPVGEFRRYDEDNNLKSILIYSDDGNEATATFYHTNGYISSQGKYINQKKEGKWKFFSEYIDGYLISEDEYSGNLRNGKSLKFYSDSTIAECINYINDVKQGEWVQYYASGAILLKSTYHNDQIHGKFEVWFENGQIEFSGYYKNNVRDGLWHIYNEDGSEKYNLDYVEGKTNDKQMFIDENNYLDSLEKNKDKIADPEKVGIIK
jgi:antitoxin component YwqK of YwqJK toxin-antitoxin module